MKGACGQPDFTFKDQFFLETTGTFRIKEGLEGWTLGLDIRMPLSYLAIQGG